MADKSFEQQVKNELSALRMKPGVAVWSGVEAALHQERKRRWLVWLFLLASVAGASFWGYYYFNQDTKETADIPAQTRSLPKEEPKKISERKEATPVISQTQIQKSTEPAIKMATVPTVQMENTPGVKQAVTSSAKKIPVKNKTDHSVLVDQDKGSNDVVKSKQESQVNDVPKTQSALITEKTTDNSRVNDDKKNIEKTTAATQQVVTGKDSIPALTKNDEKIIETIPAIPTASGEAPPAALTVVKNKKNKWQWNIAVDAGSGGLRDAIKLPVFAGRSADAAAPAGPSNGLPAPLLTVEPAVKDAFSFGIQLQATKQLGKKHRFGLSAGYSLFQTSMNVGRRVDSAMFFNNASAAYSSGLYSSSFYYTNTDSTAYTNKYHFLRLGADLYTPFRLFNKIAFQWQLGAGINILAATNGLHYDPVTKKLFSNNALYAKTQSYISTGIDLSIGKTPFLYVGPHWQYSFTNLTSKPGGDQHLFLSSIKVSFVLPKKKK